MLKQLRLFFFFYNKAIKTNIYYIVCSKNLLPLMPFLYTRRIITFYYIKTNKLFVYLPSFSVLSKNYNFKYYRTFHTTKQLQLSGLYLTNAGLYLGSDLKKKKFGGRLLYLV